MLRSRSLVRSRRGRWVGKLTAGYSSSSSPKKKLSEHFLEQKWRPKAWVEQFSQVHLKQIGHFWRSLSSSLALQAKNVWAVTASGASRRDLRTAEYTPRPHAGRTDVLGRARRRSTLLRVGLSRGGLAVPVGGRPQVYVVRGGV